ncbi:MAG: response regulator [Candidatus Heimdallarchaeota archaeon]
MQFREVNYLRNPETEPAGLPRRNTEYDLLIVEDNVDLQDYYQILFTMTPWNVIGLVTDGLTAIKYYEDLFRKPAIVILDIDLPGCSGFDVAQQILTENPSQKIVFVSGMIDEYSIPDDLAHLPFISKPFRTDNLLQVLDSLRGSLKQFYPAQ